MIALEFLWLFIAFFFITLGILTANFFLNLKKKKALFESTKADYSTMEKELTAKIKKENLPKRVNEKYRQQEFGEDLKKFLEEKGNDIDDFIQKLKKGEFAVDNSEFYYRIAMSYYSREKYDIAIENFKKVLHLNPDRENIYYSMGVSYTLFKHWKEAIDCFKKSIERSQSEGDSYYNLGWIYDEMKNYKTAIECYKKSLEINPTDYDSAYNNVCALAKWGKEDEAVKELEIIIDKVDIRELAKIDDDLQDLRKKGKLDKFF